jgi:hypothetical protein
MQRSIIPFQHKPKTPQKETCKHSAQISTNNQQPSTPMQSNYSPSIKFDQFKKIAKERFVAPLNF